MSFNFNHPMHALMPSLIGNGTNFLQPMPGTLMSQGSDSTANHHRPDMDLQQQMNKQPVVELKGPKLDGGGGDDKSSVNGMQQQEQMQLFNGVGMPQNNFMIMSRMMMDPSALLGLQQFPPLFGQIPPQQQSAAAQPPPPQPQQPPIGQGQQQQQQQQQAPNMLNHQQNGCGVGGGDSASIAAVGGGIMKELITCASCTLFPPNPSGPPPTTRDRPLGCRTVFVGGLPEQINEDIIREVFDRCGEITTLRLSKKNFCHIRFTYEASVDSAIYLSGYRVRIGNQSDAANCGRLHVDYAQARDDQYEWECKQRQHQREQRHRERLERDRLRPTSPPLVSHFNDHEAAAVSEKLKQDDTFGKAVQTLITWLERGDCSKKNSNTFYSMIQSTNSHVRRLAHEKQSCEEELRKANELYKKHMQSMVVQFNQIKKVFNASSHKKIWDHFTKAQRKNIEAWKRQMLEMRMEVPASDHDEDDEMEMSDDERDRDRSPMKSGGPTSSKRAKLDNDSLKEENDSLKCQLQVYKNEVTLVKSDLKNDTDIKEQQIKVLQETIRNMQTQLLDKERDSGQRIKDLEEKLKSANVKELLLKTKIATSNNNQANRRAESSSTDDHGGQCDSNSETTSEPAILAGPLKWERVDEDDARIISLVSAFLVVHPFGASTDYIWSYVNRFVPVRPKGLEEILARYSNLFVEDVTGVGARIERKWRYSGFEGEN